MKLMNIDYFIIGQFSSTAALLVIVPVYFNHLLANTRDKLRDRREQDRILISAFEPELNALLGKVDDCRHVMTENAYNKHEATVRSYMRYLSWFDKYRFIKLWHRLAMVRVTKKLHVPFYTQYSDRGSLDERAIKQPLAIQRIQDIISFASRNK